MGVSRRGFWKRQVFLPLLVLGVAFVLLEWSGLDVWWSGHFYDAQAHAWPFKDNWLIQTVLHKGGRLFFFALLGVIALLFLSSWVLGGSNAARRSLAYLFVATGSAPAIILQLKNRTHIYCPWDLTFFGGERPYIRWFDPVSADLPIGHCFPAAHAGSGYAFVSLYFFCWAVCPRYRVQGLMLGLCLGMVNGVTQQMRGAHFVSHDIAALAICWLMSVVVFLLFFRKQLRWH